jgi:glyoxylase-like metal-dependent hydrolase (beta-lactamase superfamily II)
LNGEHFVHEIIQEEVVQLSPLVQRITQRNPGPMTDEGTNTYLIGEASVVVLDPGADRDEHCAAILSAMTSRSAYAIIPTHAHPDHWPLAPRLAVELGAPTWGFKPHFSFTPTRSISDRHILQDEGWTLQAIQTPGHSSDHMCYYLREEKALFTGDHVMGWATTVLPHPDANLNDYMASLERLRSIPMDIIYPAHGMPIQQPKQRIEELIAHRRMRSEQILESLRRGAGTVPEIVAQVYKDVDAGLHPVAQSSVLAHLDALLAAGLVVISEPSPDILTSRYGLV